MNATMIATRNILMDMLSVEFNIMSSNLEETNEEMNDRSTVLCKATRVVK